MKAVIAEKPSVAREIAVLLGATEKKDGYLSGNGYFVTWALGHLITPAMPEDYGVKGFQKDVLPIIPNPFQLVVRKIKSDKGYVTDTRALAQLKVIATLIEKCNSIIVATDAGREGELIFRYIYNYLKCTKPFERLWISSLTEKSIKQGFQKLQPGSNFDGLYHAALSRSRADWLVGINASQALTIAAGGDSYSLGRVQTPTLSLICGRFVDHIHFVVQKYWQIGLAHSKDFIQFKSISRTKWQDKKQVEEVLKIIQREGFGIVEDLKVKDIAEYPPHLFDLSALQKEANSKLGFSAADTLEIAQNLYEHKFITYPQTASKYIPQDLWEEIPQLARVLNEVAKFKPATAKLPWGRFNKRIVNDSKVTDHHGILITSTIPSALTAKENSIYEMIAYRLLEALMPACIQQITDVCLRVKHYDFSLNGYKILDPGWRSIKGNFFDDDTEQLEQLPDFEKGEEVKIKNASILEKKTKPPPLYTEAGLLTAMENAGKELADDRERKVMQNIGLGTAATRAAIIEILFKRNYIIREKKSLKPTLKGLHVYDLVKERKIANVSLTAEWEIALEKIESGQLDPALFRKEMEVHVFDITHELLNSSVRMEQIKELVCPRCKKEHLVIKEKFVKCPDGNCNWIQFRTVCGIQVSLEDIEELVKKGRTSLLKGMQSKAGKTFDAYIVMNDDSGTRFEFETTKARKK